MNVQTNKKGFTIIEVVLVLAIAALIFLMIFIALPALQRGQRDTQRKDDLSRFTSQITSFQSSNNGSVPTGAAALTSFITNYMNKGNAGFKDPHSGNDYVSKYQSSAPAVEGEISYSAKAMCSAAGDGSLTATTSPRNFAVSIWLENGAPFCQDNQ
jgi:prepilin-type N-terminal cleavage/methylation domain-containing protein